MTTASSQKGAFRRNVKWQLVGSASQAVLSGVLLLLMGRELGTSGFGVFSIVMGYVYVANLLFEPRMQDVAARQFWNFNPNSIDRKQSSYFIDLFGIETLGKLLPCAALVLLAPYLADFGKLRPNGATLIIVAAIGVYVSKVGNGLSVGLLRVLGRSDFNAYCATGELLLRVLLTLVLIKFHTLTILAAILVLCFSGFLSNLLQWTLTMRQLKNIHFEPGEWRFSSARERFRENRRLLYANLGLSASDLMNKDLDVALLSPLLPSDQIGIYKMAKNIALLTWRAVDPFCLALMPEVNRLVSLGDLNGVKLLLARSALGLLGLAAGLGLMSYFALSFFGDSLLGRDFSDISKLMPWMLIGIVSSAPLVWGHALAVALNRAELALLGSLFGSVVGLFAFLTLPSLYGMYGAGMAWTLTFLFNFTFTAGVSHYVLRKRARSSMVRQTDPAPPNVE